MYLLNILRKLAQCYYTKKWQLSTVLMEVIFAITLRNMKQILSLFSVIIRHDLSIKCVKAFPTTFQLYFHFMLLS